MARGNHRIEGAAWPHALAIHGAVVLHIGLGQAHPIDEDMAPGVHTHPLARKGYHPLDVGITGRVSHPRQAADQGQVDHQAAQGIGAGPCRKHRIEVVG